MEPGQVSNFMDLRGFGLSMKNDTTVIYGINIGFKAITNMNINEYEY